MMETTTTVITKLAVLKAAEALGAASQALNAADGDYAWQRGGLPYKSNYDTFRQVLGMMLGDDTTGEIDPIAVEKLYAAWMDNGSVEEAISGLGWKLVIS